MLQPTLPWSVVHQFKNTVAPQDFLTTAFLVTGKDVFYDRAAFCQLVSYLGDACDSVDLPPPTLLKPLELWTGKQLFSLLVRPNAATKCARASEVQALQMRY